ncbi:MAG TPA: chorismate lyase [Methylophilaceae bacterium]|nr:chorismate lyase [Methylophilaceae bacterium]
MKTRAKHPSSRAAWLPKPAGSGAYRHWLVDAGSLTRRLQAHCKAFSVQKVRQQRGRALRDEAQLLGMRAHENALLREVFLCCGDRPLVFAHSVLPRSSLRGAWHGLGRLGPRPLGAALFANPVVVRTPLSYRKLAPSHALYRRAAELLNNKPPCLWARRSVFTLRARSIMVTEVFLPGVLEL